MGANRVGVDVFWDHEKRGFRKKKLALDKCPMKFRCPNCGKILVGINNRDFRPVVSYIHEESEEGELIQYGHERLVRVEKPNPFVDMPPLELSFYGGVCEKCHLTGFGNYGTYGLFVGSHLRAEEEKRKKVDEERKLTGDVVLWLNGELKFVKGVIEDVSTREIPIGVQKTFKPHIQAIWQSTFISAFNQNNNDEGKASKEAWDVALKIRSAEWMEYIEGEEKKEFEG